VHITSALGVMSRRELDARKSEAPSLTGKSTLAETTDAWKSLATIFMDYENFTPQNRLIQYSEGPDGLPAPIHPYCASDPDMTALASRCYDLNPTNPERASIFRDEVWIKEWLLQVRSFVSAVLRDFNRSGENRDLSEAEVDWMSAETQSRWVYHAHNKSRRYPSVVTYAYGVLDQSQLNTFGRSAGEGGRDSSVYGNNTGSVEKANAARKKRNAEARAEKKAKVTKTGKSIEDPLQGLTAALKEHGEREMQLEMLKFYALNAPTPEAKQEAWFEMNKMKEAFSKSITASPALADTSTFDKQDSDVENSDGEVQ